MPLLSAYKKMVLGELAFPRFEPPYWLSSTKWFCLEAIHEQKQTQQVVFIFLYIHT